MTVRSDADPSIISLTQDECLASTGGSATTDHEVPERSDPGHFTQSSGLGGDSGCQKAFNKNYCHDDYGRRKALDPCDKRFIIFVFARGGTESASWEHSPSLLEAGGKIPAVRGR